MSIVRVQSAQTFLISGSTLQITLPTAPTSGNTLFMIVGSKNVLAGPSPAINSISQAGATWQRVQWSTDETSITLELWYAQNIGITGTIATINLAGTLPTGAILIEYSGLYKYSPLLDKEAGADGNDTSPISGYPATTSKPDELFIGAIGNVRGDTLQSAPTNGFTQVRQVSTNPAGGTSHVVTGAYEKIVSSIGSASMGVTIGTAQSWLGIAATFVADVFVTQDRTTSIDMWIADSYQRTALLSGVVAQQFTRTAGMSFEIEVYGQTVSSSLDVFSWAPGYLFAGLEVVISGEADRLIPMDVYLIGTAYMTAQLQVFKSLYFVRWARLDVHVGTSSWPVIYSQQSRKTKLSVAVLAPRSQVPNITTPEGSQYLDCRPVWCSVPKARFMTVGMSLVVRGFWVPMNINISAT